MTFIFSSLCFLEACLYGKYRNKEKLIWGWGGSCQTSKEVDFWFSDSSGRHLQNENCFGELNPETELLAVGPSESLALALTEASAGPSLCPLPAPGARRALGMVGSAVVSLAAGLCIPFGLCLVWVGVTTSLLWRKLRQRSKLGRISNLMTCLQILYFFQGREEEGEERASWPLRAHYCFSL